MLLDSSRRSGQVVQADDDGSGRSSHRSGAAARPIVDP